MTNGAYAGLRRAPRASTSGPCDDETKPDDDNDDVEGKQKENTTMSNPTPAAPAAQADAASLQASIDQAVAVAVAETQASERQRVADVFASDDVKGREGAAAELLSNSDMKADAIVAMLPKLTPSAAVADDDGAQMLGAMREGAAADLGTGGGDDLQASDNHGWAKAHAKVGKMFGLKGQ